MEKTKLKDFFKNIIHTIGNFISDDEVDIEVPLTGDLAKDPIAEAFDTKLNPIKEIQPIERVERTLNLSNRDKSNKAKTTNMAKEQEIDDESR